MNNVFEHYLAGERIYNQIMSPVCEKYRLTFTELTVIMFLYNNPALDTASDIVKCRNIAKSHVSVSVYSLEEKGLITKTYCDGNKKSIHLKLTDLATPVILDGKTAQDQFSEIILDGVSKDERLTLIKIRKKMDDNIKKYIDKKGQK